MASGTPRKLGKFPVLIVKHLQQSSEKASETIRNNICPKKVS